MSGVIVHCPGCGAALMANPRVAHAQLINAPHVKRLDLTFESARIDHHCPEGNLT